MTWFTFAFLTALSVAVHDTCVKKWFSHLTAYEMFVFPLLYSLPFTSISLLFISVPPLDRIFYVTFIISLPLNAVPFFMYIKAIKISPLSLTVPYLAFTPVFMIGTGFLMLNEVPDIWGVAGIAAAEGNNGIGMCGVAWNARIMPVKVLQSSGTGNSSDFAQGIEYASDNGATVINMSLGSYGESQTVKTALENAYAGTGDGEGSIMVAAAGNNGYKVDPPFPPYPIYKPMFPACYSFIIGVQASTSSGGRAIFSNMDLTGPVSYTNSWGHNYEINAPGVGILSCKPNGSYWSKNGTSMASPIVAATVSLMRLNDTAQSGEEIFAKLIQGANSGIVDIYNSLNIILTPDLYYIEYTIVDTLPGCDGDGIADAGETIELYFTIKNAGGQADSVWTKIRFGEFEDTTTATLIDTTSLIGSMSAYSTMTGELDPLVIEIDVDVANNRDIVFEQEIGCENSNDSIVRSLILKIENGEELTGVVHDTLRLTADKLWIVNGSFKIANDGVLIISPGTNLLANAKIVNDGKIISHGTIDSIINIEGKSIIGLQNGYLDFLHTNISLSSFVDNTFYEQYGIFRNCLIKAQTGLYKYSFFRCTLNFHDCVLSEFDSKAPFFYCGPTYFEKCNFMNFLNAEYIIRGSQSLFKNSNFDNINSITFSSSVDDFPSFEKCNFLDESNKSVIFASYGYTQYLQNQYWGTIDSINISNKIFDFYEDASLSEVIFMPLLNMPSDSAHGCVWKVEIDSIDPQDEYMDPLGSGLYKFDVYFNRPMDTIFAPLLTFGVREPYTQHIVRDSVSWNADSTIWSAYRTIDMTTGDGIQRIRVYGAKDTDGFEIPIENSRFEFVIQAASAASIEFYATAGIGKVELEWPPTPTEDALGYNLYRSYNLTDSTYSDTLMINTELILDTVYIDYNVIPDTTYHYFYKTLGTDMVETDFSKKVTATPFDAANGDANGDLAVNVLDITTIVSYMLNQNPSPFLFDAADVNYDNEINVLDIIGLVQLINGKKSVSAQPLPEISNDIAYYYLNDNKLSIESKGNVAALQFKLRATYPQLTTHHSPLTSLKIFSLANGFEFAYAVVDNKIIGFLYSLSGKQLPEGITQLLRFEGMDISDIEITEIFGGDLKGDYVPVLKKGANNSLAINEAELQVSPNPFTHSTIINYTIPENGMVNMRIFDLSGAEVSTITNAYRNAGYYSVNWDGVNSQGQKLKSGIYLLQMKVKSVSCNYYNNEVKVVLTR